MRFSSLRSRLAGASLLAARQEAAAGVGPVSTDPFLLIGGGPSGTISAATFDGTNFDFLANNTMPGTSPSWLLYKDPGLVYAVDENSNNTRLFSFDATTRALTLVQNATGSRGVVSLEFNMRRDRVVGAAFGQGQIDVWDVSAADGTMRLMKQIVSDDALGPNAARQDAPHPHQAVLDNSGQFVLVNDLGTDTILVLDALHDTFDVVNRVRVPHAGCGPRHGAFFPHTGAAAPTAYFLVCEMLNVVEVFALSFSASNLTLTPIQTISTFGPAAPPRNASTATAGEIAVSADNAHVYVSNRNTGGDTDSIAHFRIAPNRSLTFVETVSSGGRVPRMFSLSRTAAQEIVFAANQDGASGLVALARRADGGLAAAADAAPPQVALSQFGRPGQGPQFVQQVPVALPIPSR